jgi:hypothetical protein
MNARTLVLVAVAALALPAGALSKGPAAASVSGPELASPIAITGYGEGGGSTALGALVQASGFFPAAFGQSPDPMLAERPEGDLGPRYALTFSVPTSNTEQDTIRMDVYPYAAGGAVTYTAPGQPIFSSETDGGWFRGGPELERMLLQAGLPRSARSGGSGSTFTLDSPWPLVTGIAVALLVALGLLAATRRRQATAAAR